MIGNGNSLDIANYQPANPPAECWYAEGVRTVIVGCQRPHIARQQIPVLRAAGIIVRAVYAYQYGVGGGDTAELDNAIAVAREFAIKRVWIDAEEGEFSIDELRASVAYVREAGLEPGIYTGPGYWRAHMDNTAEFSALPLWYASYYWSGGINEWAGFGGWGKAAIHQYTSTGTRNDSDPSGASPQLCGVNVDYNFDFEPLEEEQVTDLEKEAWEKRRQLALLSQDLDKYEAMLDVYDYAKGKGYVA